MPETVNPINCSHCSRSRIAPRLGLCSACAAGKNSLFGESQIARLNRRAAERSLRQPIDALEVQEGMFDDCKPVNRDGQVSMF